MIFKFAIRDRQNFVPELVLSISIETDCLSSISNPVLNVGNIFF